MTELARNCCCPGDSSRAPEFCVPEPIPDGATTISWILAYRRIRRLGAKGSVTEQLAGQDRLRAPHSRNRIHKSPEWIDRMQTGGTWDGI